MPTVGVVSFQGDFEKHIRRVEELGVRAVGVRTPEELRTVDAIILPGGESTTIGMLLERFGLIQPLRAMVDAGIPVLGTCAGAILLAEEILGADQPHVGGMSITVRRNAYGRQIESFEASLSTADSQSPWSDPPVLGVFIRAPVIESVRNGVETLLSLDNGPVLVREGSRLAATFHPELTPDTRIHRYFLSEVAGLS